MVERAIATHLIGSLHFITYKIIYQNKDLNSYLFEYLEISIYDR